MLDFIQSVARGAGEILMRHFGHLGAGDVSLKAKRDLQTKADLESEAYIIERIRKECPEDSIYAEETRPIRARTDRWWFIDPLDGTTGFAHGLPVFAVSIGLWDRGALRYGVVHAPYLRETFTGELGRGAHLNGEPIRVSAVSELENAVVGTGFPYKIAELSNQNLDDFEYFCTRAQGIRRLGSASIDLCYVAAGRLDAFWEGYLGPYDSAAATVMIREAGGTISDYAGGDDFLFGETVVATNGKLHPLFVSTLRPLDAGTVGRYKPAPEMT